MLEINDYITIATGSEFLPLNCMELGLYQITKSIDEVEYSRFEVTAIHLTEQSKDPLYFEVEEVDRFNCYDDLAYEWPHGEVINLGDCVFKLV